MRQQINLYQPAESLERKPLAALTVVIALGVIAGCLTGVSQYARHRVATLEQSVQLLRAQQSTQQQQLTRANELVAARTTPAELTARIQQLSMTLNEREQALQLLQSGAAGQTTGFAARLEALARRHVSGLWLDSVRLSGTNTSMSLQGATTNPEAVPLYLQSLAADPVLTGTRFDQFVIHRPQLEDQASQTGSVAGANAATLRFSAGNTALPSESSQERRP